jgi:hypothetical protein
MTTLATSEFPEIDWEIGDQLEYDPDERMRVFSGIGHDKEGKKYTGSIYYTHGCFDEIKDIELE